MVIIKTTGQTTFRDKNGQMQVRNGNVYLHFIENCLKIYIPDFKYEDISVPEDTKSGLSLQATNFLKTLGIKI